MRSGGSIPDDVPRLASSRASSSTRSRRASRPAARSIYSVCTFTRAEGPEQARAFVARSGLASSEHRTWPPDADAFYLARFER